MRFLNSLFGGGIADLLTPPSHEMDIANEASVRGFFKEHRPQLVINTAAYTGVDQAEKEGEKAFSANALGPGYLAACCRESGCKMLHISTDYVFSGKQKSPYIESDRALPCNTYGRSKFQGEQSVFRELPEAVIVRTSWVYGARGRNFLTAILARARETGTLSVVADQYGAPCAVTGLAEALFVIAEQMLGGRFEPGVYHYQTKPATTWFEFADTAIKEAFSQGVLDSASKVLPISSVEYPTSAARPAHAVLDASKLEQALGCQMPDWRDELVQVIRDLKKD